MVRRLADDIIEGLREAAAFEEGRITLTARTVRLPTPKLVSAEDVLRIRRRLGVSQAVLGVLLGVKRMSVAAWEQGKRRPHGPARRLLELLDADPALAKKLMAS